MKINKLKCLLIAVFCVIMPLRSEILCMEKKEKESKYDRVTTIQLETEAVTYSSIPTGGIIHFSGETAPNGWLICNGKKIKRSKYEELFSVIGRKYTPKDVQENNFCVPDLRGRVIVGVDEGIGRITENNTLGQTGGNEKNKYEIERLTGGITPTNGLIEVWKPGRYGTFDGRHDYIKISNQNDNSVYYENKQPYQVLNYIIKTKEDRRLENRIGKIDKIDDQLTRLKSEVSELQNQNKELMIALKGLTQPKPYIEFYNNEVNAWKYYENTKSGWRNMPFDNFRNSGEIRPGQSSSPYSYISIPESGVYSLTAWYIWQDISKGMNGPYTSIGVNGYYRVLSQTTLPTTSKELTKELGSLSYTGFLTGGDQVSLFISTHVEGTPYYPNHFKLRVERII